MKSLSDVIEQFIADNDLGQNEETKKVLDDIYHQLKLLNDKVASLRTSTQEMIYASGDDYLTIETGQLNYSFYRAIIWGTISIDETILYFVENSIEHWTTQDDFFQDLHDWIDQFMFPNKIAEKHGDLWNPALEKIKEELLAAVKKRDISSYNPDILSLMLGW